MVETRNFTTAAPKRSTIRTDLEEGNRCTSRFASMRCRLQSGHAGSHQHDEHQWGGRRGRKRY